MRFGDRMKETTIKEAQELVRRFVEERNWQTPPEDILIHMVEEQGEVARNILAMKNYGGQHVKKSDNNMDEELADMLYLLLKLANETKVDLDDALLRKLEKNAKRFPVEKK